MSTIGFETHDHGACVDDAMAAAEARCAASDLRLTPIRRRVLELLLAEHRAWGISLPKGSGRSRPSPIARWTFW